MCIISIGLGFVLHPLNPILFSIKKKKHTTHLTINRRNGIGTRVPLVCIFSERRGIVSQESTCLMVILGRWT